jgi:hypothetical protein
LSNKAVSFLKRLGQILSAGLQVAAEILPGIAPFVNLTLPASVRATATTIESTVESEISLMAQSVTAAETMANVIGTPGLTGAQKAAAAGTGILQVLLNSEMMAGKTIHDPAGAQAASATIAGGLADFMNAIDGSKLPTPAAQPTVIVTGSAPAILGSASSPSTIPAE